MPSDPGALIASLIWGTTGCGLFVYGWKQQSSVPLFGGLTLVATSYFVESAFLMSLLAVVLLAAVCWLAKRGG